MNPALVLRMAPAGLALLAIAGCATEPRTVEADYGSSVRQMVEAQTLYAGRAPSPEPVMGIDGDKAARVLNEYRKDVARPPEITNNITLNVGK